jgi:arylsulfatase
MSRKPSLIVFLADGVRHDVLAAAGNTRIQMPNVNRLAESSAVFHRAYCAQPVSPPPRSTILTGRHPHNTGILHHGIPLARDVPTLAELIDDPDYVSSYMGLWVLGNEIDRQHGFDHWISIEDGYRNKPGEADCEGRMSTYAQYLRENGFREDDIKRGYPIFTRYFCTRLPERFSKAGYLAMEARKFIKAHTDRPFVLFVSFLDPHAPNASVNDDLYPRDEVDLPPAFNLQPPKDIPLRARLNRQFYKDNKPDTHACSTVPLADEAAWREKIARYWGQLTHVDSQIGKILGELRDLGRENDTIVTFTSDHGDMMGDFRMLAKGLLQESSVRVPLVISIPGLTEKGIELHDPVSQVHLVPTFLDLLGLKTEKALDGASLLPVIRGESPAADDVFIEWHGIDGADKWAVPYYPKDQMDDVCKIVGAPVRTIVTRDGWKMSLSGAGEHELYNLSADPLETKNLYSSGDADAIIETLTRKIRDWQDRTGDEVEFVRLR